MYGTAMHAVASSNGIQSSKIDEYEADLKAAGDSTSGARKSLIYAMTADLDLKGLPQLARMGKGLTAMNPDSTPGENLQAIIEAISTGQQRGLRRRGVYGLDFNYAERDKAYRDSGQRPPWVHQGHRPAWCCRRAMGANKQTRENRA